MALITRVSRLFQADLHAVLDRIEEPDVLLKQAVREMEEEISREDQRLKLLEHEQGQLKTREDDLAHALLEIESELDVCFESDKEDLAKTLIRRKLEMQRVGNDLSSKSIALTDSVTLLKTQQKEYRLQLENMKQKAELLTDAKTQESETHGWMMPSAAVHDDDVEVAYLREKQMRSSS